ncbi:alcohol dehydrogenase catalytic domain-containing protein [Actinopolymorpha sp. NPDC004070]
MERPTDVLVRITAANICGSDLHMYEGRTDFDLSTSRSRPSSRAARPRKR